MKVEYILGVLMIAFASYISYLIKDWIISISLISMSILLFLVLIK